MQTILVLNSKGGSGKTTIATNLAAYYASRHVTVLKDYDPQGSASQWLKRRSPDQPKIHGMEAFKPSVHGTQSWQMRLPRQTATIIIDSPACIELVRYVTMLRTVDKIIIPVIASPIDIRATASFFKQLRSFMKMYPMAAEVALVANRVKSQSRISFNVQRSIAQLDIPLITSISDSDHYLTAADMGLGILELGFADMVDDKADWQSLISWLDGQQASSYESKKAVCHE